MREFDDVKLLEAALEDLGIALEADGVSFDLFLIGGAALLLQEPGRARATEDVDVAATIEPDGTLGVPVPLSPALIRAAVAVAKVHGLSPGWINSAAAASFDHLVPDGAIERADVRRWGRLTIRVASRTDLLRLKLRAAMRRGAPGERYRHDIALARPTDAELEDARAWVRSLESAPDASFDERLGVVLEQVRELRDGG